MRRRVLRHIVDDEDLYEQIPYVLPVVEYARKKVSPIGTILFFFGGLLMFIAIVIKLLEWLSSVPFLPFLLPISIPIELLAWTPAIFAAGLILSIIGTIIAPSASKIILLVLLILGYAFFALGWIDYIFGWLKIT